MSGYLNTVGKGNLSAPVIGISLYFLPRTSFLYQAECVRGLPGAPQPLAPALALVSSAVIFP
jgi:hypothetical protein